MFMSSTWAGCRQLCILVPCNMTVASALALTVVLSPEKSNSAYFLTTSTLHILCHVRPDYNFLPLAPECCPPPLAALPPPVADNTPPIALASCATPQCLLCPAPKPVLLLYRAYL